MARRIYLIRTITIVNPAAHPLRNTKSSLQNTKSYNFIYRYTLIEQTNTTQTHIHFQHGFEDIFQASRGAGSLRRMRTRFEKDPGNPHPSSRQRRDVQEEETQQLYFI